MSPDDFRRLVAAGLSTDQIALVMELMERDARAHAEAEEARKARGRERIARWRAKRVTETQPKDSAQLTRDRGVRAEDKSQTSQMESRKNDTPRARLEAVLDAERAEAVIQHRQRLRKPLTTHAAKLLAEKFARCRDPNAAADTMVGNGWLGFEPEWLAKPVARGSPAQAGREPRRGLGGVFSDLVEHLESGSRNEHRTGPAAEQAVLSLPYRRAG